MTIGDINNITKNGHQYLWVSYKSDTSNNRPVKVPEFVYVESIYEEKSFSNAFGWS